MLGQAFELGGGLVGLVAGVALGPALAARFTNRPGMEAALISLLVVFAALSIGHTIGYLIGARFGSLARRANLGVFDASLGAGFGVVVTVVAFWLIASFLIQGPSRPVARALRHSTVLGWANALLPKPPDVVAYLRQYLQTSGFPQVFVGFPRPVGPPVKLPSNAEIRGAVTAARDATVRVVVPACGGTQLGTGWVGAPSTVVTNAHVVAGGGDVTVIDAAGEHPGVVVLFDGKTDVAVVHADGLAGAPLDLHTSVVESGTPGATLGYPGSAGGTLQWHRAGVQGHFNALGRDIYGRSLVRRDVYELRTRVRQGDSGGPFVLPNGDVAGVVFAASTTNGDTGYALTGAEVAAELRRGSRRTDAVPTGSCTH